MKGPLVQRGLAPVSAGDWGIVTLIQLRSDNPSGRVVGARAARSPHTASGMVRMARGSSSPQKADVPFGGPIERRATSPCTGEAFPFRRKAACNGDLDMIY